MSPKSKKLSSSARGEIAESVALVRAPFGWLSVIGSERGVMSIHFGKKSPTREMAIPVREAVIQLQEYFLGERRKFNFLLAPRGTAFQQSVWAVLRKIPSGRTSSYSDIAAKMGQPKASRAVGMANNRNPLPIVVPCHRVIGKSGDLTGYAGGLKIKRWLLTHEGAFHRKPAIAE